MSGWADCACGRSSYNPDNYTSCFDCFQDRRSDYLDCVFCGRWHAPKFSTCFQCRQESPGRDEAGAHLRRLIHIRDGFTCRYCGDSDGPFQVDHIQPCAHGGKAEQWNLQTLCTPCNRAKGRDFTERDETQLHDSMEAYYSYLWEYLSVDEQQRLHAAMVRWLTGSKVMTPEQERVHLLAVYDPSPKNLATWKRHQWAHVNGGDPGNMPSTFHGGFQPHEPDAWR